MTEITENYVVIIGAMKSGTTTLFAHLARHPRIAPAHPKEPGFFAFDEVHARGWDWYHGLFDFDPARHSWRLEASTDYTKAPFVTGVWERMRTRPQARYKLIYIMRHPLRRLESHARHVQRTRKEIGQIVSPRADHGFDAGVSLPSLAMTRYAGQIDAFAEARAAGDLHLTTLEELERDPARVVAQICAFLDLPPLEAAAPERRNAAGDKRMSTEGWRKIERMPVLTDIGKRVLSKPVRDRIKARFMKATPVEGRFVLTPEEERTLGALLGPDLARLAEEYGIDAHGLWGIASGEAAADGPPLRRSATGW